MTSWPVQTLSGQRLAQGIVSLRELGVSPLEGGAQAVITPVVPVSSKALSPHLPATDTGREGSQLLWSLQGSVVTAVGSAYFALWISPGEVC